MPPVRSSAVSKKPKPTAKRSTVVADARKNRSAAPTRQGVWENVKGILSVLLIFFFVRTFLVEAYRIPSGSMIPSMLIGDWLFVNKLRFGPHIPFTDVNLPGYAEPARFDIVVFVSPPQIDQPWDPTPTLVKRIVGMPGDTLHMRAAALFVNGVEQRQGYGATSEPGDPNEVSPLFDWQKEVGLTASRFGPAPAQPTHDNWGPFVVPQRHYFMMGDNRYNSKDSRYWSFVPRDNIRGRPLFVYYSWNTESDRPLPFLTDIRWGRIGHWIK